MSDDDISARNDESQTALCIGFKKEASEAREKSMRELLKSTKLKTAHFGSDENQDEALIWAAKNPERHDIAKLLIEKRPKRKEEKSAPPGSKTWSVIEWAVFKKLPGILWLLIASLPRSAEIDKMLESAKTMIQKTTSPVERWTTRRLIDNANGLATSEDDDEDDDDDEIENAEITQKTEQKEDHSQRTQDDEMMDALMDPPIALICRFSETYEAPQFQVKLETILTSFQASVV